MLNENNKLGCVYLVGSRFIRVICVIWTLKMFDQQSVNEIKIIIGKNNKHSKNIT